MTLSIKWVGPPNSYTEGRARQLRYVTIHYTAGSEGPTSAEAGAAYDKKRTDGTSCHYFTDSLGPAVQEVKDEDTSHSAFPKGNTLGIHIEICGTAQTRAQWLDATSKATLQTTAELVAYLLTKHKLPNHRLSVAETRAAWYAPEAERYKYEGFNDHGTITKAYPEDGGTHTDVGPGFPWDVFEQMITDALEEQDMPTPEEIAKAVWDCDQIPAPPPPNNNADWDTNKKWQADNALSEAVILGRVNKAAIADLSAKVDQILAAIKVGVVVTEQVNLTPEAVKAVADATADEIHADPERDGV